MENFEEMHGGVYQADPQAEALIAAARELALLTRQVELAMATLQLLAVQYCTSCEAGVDARKAIEQITGLRKPKEPGSSAP
jgi:hypothetical protein